LNIFMIKLCKTQYKMCICIFVYKIYSKQVVWPCYLKDWEMHVQFKVHGSGKKNLHGDGIAIWYTRDRLHPGPVFGNQDKFHGLALFVDTFRNDLHGMDRSFPYISAMVNNGSVSYDHGKDGRSSELGGWVRLPTGYYFGASAATGDLSDNHDIISMKLYQLMVEHSPEEENLDWTKIEPSVSLLKSPKGEPQEAVDVISVLLLHGLFHYKRKSVTWTGYKAVTYPRTLLENADFAIFKEPFIHKQENISLCMKSANPVV
uniref:L-type lectin-like domain-containing protein n=1 Tax=Periophthalmus magnuspinnatus TaxID=409849 RepID=A0A3B3ZXA8_9GOBI